VTAPSDDRKFPRPRFDVTLPARRAELAPITRPDQGLGQPGDRTYHRPFKERAMGFRRMDHTEPLRRKLDKVDGLESRTAVAEPISFAVPQQLAGQPLEDHPGHEPIDATLDYLSNYTTFTYRVPASQARRTGRRNQRTKLKPGRHPNERPPMK
jgi:hypothetical protein